MKVTSFEIEESKVNKGQMFLVAITETGEKFVVSGDIHMPTYLVSYNRAWDAIGQEAMKKLHLPNN